MQAIRRCVSGALVAATASMGVYGTYAAAEAAPNAASVRGGTPASTTPLLVPRPAPAPPPPAVAATTAESTPSPKAKASPTADAPPPPSPKPTPFDIQVPTATSPTVTSTSILQDVPLHSIEPAITNDRGLTLGSLGSGLFAVGNDEYWTVSDRGPNGELGDSVRTFIVPQYQPALVKIKLVGGVATVLQTIPMTTKSGKGLTGLPPLTRAGDPAAALSDGSQAGQLRDPNGLDPEGMVATPYGFWVVDEYGPSIVALSTTGQMLARFVPAGSEAAFAGAETPVLATLPAEFANRVANRGFEDVALLPDGQTIVVSLQSPLSGQDGTLTTKILTFNTFTGAVGHVYDYRFDAPRTFWKKPGKRAKSDDLKTSALVPLSQDRLLVQERTDMETRFYEVKMNDDGTLGPKRLVVNLAGVAGIPQKVEGAAMKGSDTLVLGNDNDFGFLNERSYGLNANVQPSGIKTQFVEVKLQ